MKLEVKAEKASLFGSSLLLLLLYLLFEREGERSNISSNNDELPERCYLLSWRCFNWLAPRVAQYKVSLVGGFKLGGSSIWDKFSSALVPNLSDITDVGCISAATFSLRQTLFASIVKERKLL